MRRAESVLERVIEAAGLTVERLMKSGSLGEQVLGALLALPLLLLLGILLGVWLIAGKKPARTGDL